VPERDKPGGDRNGEADPGAAKARQVSERRSPAESCPCRTGPLLGLFDHGGVGSNGRGFDGSRKNGQAPKAVKLGGEGLDQRLVVCEDGGLVVAEFRFVREVVA